MRRILKTNAFDVDVAACLIFFFFFFFFLNSVDVYDSFFFQLGIVWSLISLEWVTDI